MRHGFNSNIEVGGVTYHVQTEEHGSTHPSIDTVIVAHGRVLHRRTNSFEDLVGVGDTVDMAALGARVEQQHREVVEALRSGSLSLDDHPHGATVKNLDTLKLTLRNAQSWLADGQASLKIEVFSQAGQPVGGVAIAAFVEGTSGIPEQKVAHTNESGLASLEFPLPEIVNPDAAALVILARSVQGLSQLRYRIKPAASTKKS